MKRVVLGSVLVWLFAATALVSFVVAIDLIVDGKDISAGIAGALFVVSALLTRLPDIEGIKALGVEAKLVRQQIDRAEEILEKIKTASLVSARHMYREIAVGDRMFTSLPNAEKRQRVRDIDNMLLSLSVDPEEIAPMKKDLLVVIAYDIGNVFTHVLGARCASHLRRLQTEARAQTDPAERERLDASFVRMRETIELTRAAAPELSEVHLDLEPLLQKRIPSNVFPSADFRIFSDWIRELGQFYRDCRDDMNLAPSALNFLERYERKDEWKEKYRELFNEPV